MSFLTEVPRKTFLIFIFLHLSFGSSYVNAAHFPRLRSGLITTYYTLQFASKVTFYCGTLGISLIGGGVLATAAGATLLVVPAGVAYGIYKVTAPIISPVKSFVIKQILIPPGGKAEALPKNIIDFVCLLSIDFDSDDIVSLLANKVVSESGVSQENLVENGVIDRNLLSDILFYKLHNIQHEIAIFIFDVINPHKVHILETKELRAIKGELASYTNTQKLVLNEPNQSLREFLSSRVEEIISNNSDISYFTLVVAYDPGNYQVFSHAWYAYHEK